jgi:prevent-host-death family protein
MSASDARRNFGKLMKSIQNEPVVITRKGKDPSVMLSVEDYDKLTGKTENKTN